MRAMSVSTKHDKGVLEFRKELFERLGFDDTMADFLGNSEISPHAMEGLLGDGCAPGTAVRILMGTDAHGNDDPGWVGIEIEDEE
jgi:hypothetical protein